MLELDKLSYKCTKNGELHKVIKYLIKVYRHDKENLVNYLQKSDKTFHTTVLNYINKYDHRLLCLVNKIQSRLIKNLKVIEFKSLTFDGINQLSNKKQMIELNDDLKICNSIINFNIPKLGIVHIPCRYNENYHGKLEDYKYSYTKQNQSQISYKCKILNNKIRFALTRDDKEKTDKLDLDFKDVVGVDVNTKNNLFSLSDGSTVLYDGKIIKRQRRYEKYIAKVQFNKTKNRNVKEYGKKVIKRIQKMNRRSKYFADLKSKELVVHCKENSINHIVMEDLNLQNKNKFKLKKDGVNYNNIIKTLHLNDLKNVVKRIANKHNVTVSLVNPEYTSQTCPSCGHISRDNRKTQEMFSCVHCKYTNNADVNAAINIKNRIVVEELRKNLEEYDSRENMFIGKKYVKKSTYLEIYKNLYN